MTSTSRRPSRISHNCFRVYCSFWPPMDGNASVWLLATVEGKFPREDMKAWRLHIAEKGDDHMPTAAYFLDYMEKRTRAQQSADQAAATKKNDGSSSGNAAKKPATVAVAATGVVAAAPQQPRGNSRQQQGKPQQGVGSSTATGGGLKPGICLFCGGKHASAACRTARGWDMARRFAKLREVNVCNNCLEQGHIWKFCPKGGQCKQCDKKHADVMHRGDKPKPAAQQQQSSSSGGGAQQ